jgi:hypothetical protein
MHEALSPLSSLSFVSLLLSLQVIREATIRWAMIDQLQHPPAEFASVIRAHFKLQGPTILKQIQGWIDEAGVVSGHGNNLKSLKGQFETELAKLA